MTTHARIKSFYLPGRAGRLEALLNVGVPDATYAAVVTHPHPLFGGTMHNKVVFHAMKALSSFGFPVLRFNFRGTGLSEGEHAHGIGEVEDVQTALDWLRNEFHLPLIFAGFSFGAATGLKAACPDPDVKAIIALGTPINADGRAYEYSYLRSCTKPKLFLSGEKDEFSTPSELERLAETLPEPKKLVLVPEADHFFAGRLDEMRSHIESWITETLGVMPRTSAS